MALDYSLIMFVRTRELPVQEIRAFLIQRFALEEYSDWIGLGGEGLTASVISTDERETAELGFSYLGVNIGFRIDKFELHDIGMTNMMHMVDELLRYPDVEANFYFDESSDDKKLVKAEGIVRLYRDDFWEYGDGQLRALITHPHEYRARHDRGRFLIRTENPALNPRAVMGLLMAKFGLHFAGLELTWVDIVGGGLDISVDKYDEDPTIESKSPENAKNLQVFFYVNLFEYEAARTRMTAIARFLLDRYEGDAELLSGYDKPLLTRTNNTLTLSDEPDFWTPERKAIMLGKPLP